MRTFYTLSLTFLYIILSFTTTFADEENSLQNFSEIQGKVLRLKSGNRTVRYKLLNSVAALKTTSSANRQAKSTVNNNILLKNNFITIIKKSNNTVKTRSAKTTTMQNSGYPVFRDASNRVVVMLDNLLVTFKRDMSDTQIREWASKNNLTLLKRISEYSNSYLISKSAEVQSIDLCNSLQNHPEIVSATPNWWQSLSTK